MARGLLLVRSDFGQFRLHGLDFLEQSGLVQLAAGQGAGLLPGLGGGLAPEPGRGVGIFRGGRGRGVGIFRSGRAGHIFVQARHDVPAQGV